MKKEILCDSCNQPMKLEKKFETKERGKNHKKYRIRRFHCDLCNIDKTIYADGMWDERLTPVKSVKEAKNFFAQEKEKG